MAIYTGFFDAAFDENLGGYDRAYGSSDFVGYFEEFIGSGVCVYNNENSMQVTVDEDSLRAVVAPGYLFIRGYWLKNDEPYTVNLSNLMNGTYAIYAHLDLSTRTISIDQMLRANPEEYHDSLVLAYLTVNNDGTFTVEDTRDNSNICGLIDSAGNLSIKLNYAINYIDQEIDTKLESIEQSLRAQEAVIDEKVEEANSLIEKILPPSLGTLKFSVNPQVGEEWLKCNGGIIERDNYPGLFELIVGKFGDSLESGGLPLFWNSGTKSGRYNMDSMVYGGGKFLGGCKSWYDSNDHNVYVSEDGISWEGISLNSFLSGTPSYSNYIGIVLVLYGDGVWLALGKKGSNNNPLRGRVFYSRNLKDWEEYSLVDTNNDPVAGAYGNGVFVVVSGGYIEYSRDGRAWTRSIALPSIDKSQWSNNLLFSNGRFYLGGGRGVLYSNDGANWTKVEFDLSEFSYKSDITYCTGLAETKGILLTLIKPGSYGSPFGLISRDQGETWEISLNPPTNFQISSVHLALGFNGYFIIVGSNSATSGGNLSAYSQDGVNWTQISLPMNNIWVFLIQGKGRFITGGGMGYAYSNFPFSSAKLPNIALEGVDCYIKAKEPEVT